MKQSKLRTYYNPETLEPIQCEQKDKPSNFLAKYEIVEKQLYVHLNIKNPDITKVFTKGDADPSEWIIGTDPKTKGKKIFVNLKTHEKIEQYEFQPIPEGFVKLDSRVKERSSIHGVLFDSTLLGKECYYDPSDLSEHWLYPEEKPDNFLTKHAVKSRRLRVHLYRSNPEIKRVFIQGTVDPNEWVSTSLPEARCKKKFINDVTKEIIEMYEFQDIAVGFRKWCFRTDDPNGPQYNTTHGIRKLGQRNVKTYVHEITGEFEYFHDDDDIPENFRRYEFHMDNEKGIANKFKDRQRLNPTKNTYIYRSPDKKEYAILHPKYDIIPDGWFQMPRRTRKIRDMDNLIEYDPNKMYPEIFNYNKYAKFYLKFANYKLANPSTAEYTEKHHIIPKSLNGSDHESNLITLNTREHLFVHKLLVKCMSTGAGTDSMLLAAWFMFRNYPSTNTKYSAKLVEDANRAHSEKVRERTHVMNKDPVKIKKTAETHRGMKRSDETKQKLSDAAKQHYSNPEVDGTIKGLIQYTNKVTGITKFVNDEEGLLLNEDWVKGNTNYVGRWAYYDPEDLSSQRFTPGKQPDNWLPGEVKLANNIKMMHLASGNIEYFVKVEIRPDYIRVFDTYDNPIEPLYYPYTYVSKEDNTQYVITKNPFDLDGWEKYNKDVHKIGNISNYRRKKMKKVNIYGAIFEYVNPINNDEKITCSPENKPMGWLSDEVLEKNNPIKKYPYYNPENHSDYIICRSGEQPDGWISQARMYRMKKANS